MAQLAAIRAIAYGPINHRHSRESGNLANDVGSFAAKIQQITSLDSGFRRSDVAVISYVIALWAQSAGLLTVLAVDSGADGVTRPHV